MIDTAQQAYRRQSAEIEALEEQQHQINRARSRRATYSLVGALGGLGTAYLLTKRSDYLPLFIGSALGGFAAGLYADYTGE